MAKVPFWRSAAALGLICVGSGAAGLPPSPVSDPSPDCSKPVGSLPHADWPAGTPDPSIPIQHVVVMMQENHSFDNFFGRLNRPEYYGSEIDGVVPEQMW